MKSPNILRLAGISSIAALAAGSIACTPKGGEPDSTTPRPTPQTSMPGPPIEHPECKGIEPIIDKQTPRKVSFRLNTIDTIADGQWNVDHAKYDFGDGTPPSAGPESTIHTYPHAGSFTVNASIIMDVSKGAVSPPVRDGAVLRCPPVVVTVQ